MKGKTVPQSAIEDYPHIVFPTDLNSIGTMFGGEVIKIIDLVATIVAQRHSGKTCVTAKFDDIAFLKPVFSGQTLIFKAAVNRVWNTSMEIGVKVFLDLGEAKEYIHVVSAYLTVVAVNKEGKPIPIGIPIIPKTKDQKRRFKEADERREIRLKNRKK